MRLTVLGFAVLAAASALGAGYITSVRLPDGTTKTFQDEGARQEIQGILSQKYLRPESVKAGDNVFVTTNAAGEVTISAVTGTESDFTTNNTVLVNTIETVAPTPGDYANVSNLAVNALQRGGGTITGSLRVNGTITAANGSINMDEWGLMTLLKGNIHGGLVINKDEYGAVEIVPPEDARSVLTAPTNSGVIALVSDIGNKQDILPYPTNAIPYAALASGVQSSLDKADTALQTAPVTSVNNKTGAVSLTASDVGAVPTAGGTMTGQLTVPMLAVGRFYQAITATEDLDGAYVEICGRWFFENLSESRITCRDGMETKSVAFLSDIPSVAGLAPLASPAFTGTPTAPTPATGDNSTNIATTAFVQSALSSISVNPLAGNKYDFSTNADVYRAVKDIVEALGGSVTNFPAIP